MVVRDAVVYLGVVLSLVGLLGIAVGAYWLYVLSRGIMPGFFTYRTQRMPVSEQRMRSARLIAAELVVAVVGLAIIFSPAVRDTVVNLFTVTQGQR